MDRSVLLAGLAGALALGAIVIGLQIRRELSAIRGGQAEIRAELQQLRGGAPARRAPDPAAAAQNKTISVANHAALGSERAPVTIVEFSDFECPYCGRHVRETWPKLEAAYIATGKVRYLFRHLPLESIHKAALPAHRAAACAGEQGRFWPMHNRLFSNQKMLAGRAFDADADAVGLNARQFQACLSGGDVDKRIRADIAEAGQLGISGTPAFLIGRSNSESQTMTVARVLSGAQPANRFKEAIDALLTAAQ